MNLFKIFSRKWAWLIYILIYCQLKERNRHSQNRHYKISRCKQILLCVQNNRCTFMWKKSWLIFSLKLITKVSTYFRILNLNEYLILMWKDDGWPASAVLPQMEQPSEQHVESLHQTSQPSILYRCHSSSRGKKHQVS